jgi:phage gpG-like protein
MDAQRIRQLVEKYKDDILKEVNDRLPRKVGVIAVNHFRQNFRDSGWLDDGLHPWKKTLRQQQGGRDARYGPLTSRRNHLMRSIQANPGVGEVTVENPVPYAAIHNEGGDITTHPTVTKRMKKYAWRMVYSLAGVKGKGKLPKQLPDKAQMWKSIALTKKNKITVRAHIPQRQFMGDSHELQIKVNKAINESIERIKNGIVSLSNH